MKALILDHHFKQDIDALSSASEPEDVIRVLPAQIFGAVARELFPDEVFGPDYSKYHAPEMAPARAAYRERARKLLFELYQTFPFDVFVVPSDIYFYIRDVIQAVRDLGIRTVAVQKESGVSEQSLVQEAADTRRWFPFSGDVMTVCSERSRQFWLAAGARPEQVLVLGQPRFDIYRNGAGQDSDPLTAVGVQRGDASPILLFLSYSLDAYAENRGLDDSHRPWEQLHDETEQTLVEFARAGTYTVLFKPHPQQDAAQLTALHNRLRGVPNLFVLPGGLDTRRLIVASDVVVGFQTTAIAEAMIARKRVIYTFWTTAVAEASHLLLPFHEMGDSIDVATSMLDFAERLQRPAAPLTDTIVALRERYCDPYMGFVDGHASKRVWNEALRVQASPPQYSPSDLAVSLRRNARRYCKREAERARRRVWAWRSVGTFTSIIPGAKRIAIRAASRVDAEGLRIRECDETLKGAHQGLMDLRGPRDGFIAAARRFIRARFGAGVSKLQHVH